MQETEEPLQSPVLYPNPTSHNTTLSFILLQKTLVSVSVVDITGRVIKPRPVKEFEAGANKIEITTDDLSDGIYFIELKTGKTKKFLKINKIK